MKHRPYRLTLLLGTQIGLLDSDTCSASPISCDRDRHIYAIENLAIHSNLPGV
jgi:hypothetical protein